MTRKETRALQRGQPETVPFGVARIGAARAVGGRFDLRVAQVVGDGLEVDRTGAADVAALHAAAALGRAVRPRAVHPRVAVRLVNRPNPSDLIRLIGLVRHISSHTYDCAPFHTSLTTFVYRLNHVVRH